MKRHDIDRLVKIWLPILIILAIAAMFVFNAVRRHNLESGIKGELDRKTEILRELENLGVSNENFAFERLTVFDRARLTLVLSNLWDYTLLINGEEIMPSESDTCIAEGEDVEVILIEKMHYNGLPKRVSYIGSICQGDMLDSVRDHIFGDVSAPEFISEERYLDGKLTVENTVKFSFKLKSDEEFIFNLSPILAERFGGALSFIVKR